MTATLHIPTLPDDACDPGGGPVRREVQEDDLLELEPGWERRPAVAGGFTVRVEQFLGPCALPPSGGPHGVGSGAGSSGASLAGQIR